jgi:hypothetical protein
MSTSVHHERDTRFSDCWRIVMPVLRDLAVSQYFATVEDPRIDRTKDHALLDIIMITLCAVICGAESWVAVEEFGTTKRAWLETFLDLPHGIPSHDTFGRVFGFSTALCSGCGPSSRCVAI